MSVVHRQSLIHVRVKVLETSADCQINRTETDFSVYFQNKIYRHFHNSNKGMFLYTANKRSENVKHGIGETSQTDAKTGVLRTIIKCCIDITIALITDINLISVTNVLRTSYYIVSLNGDTRYSMTVMSAVHRKSLLNVRINVLETSAEGHIDNTPITFIDVFRILITDTCNTSNR